MDRTFSHHYSHTKKASYSSQAPRRSAQPADCILQADAEPGPALPNPESLADRTQRTPLLVLQKIPVNFWSSPLCSTSLSLGHWRWRAACTMRTMRCSSETLPTTTWSPRVMTAGKVASFSSSCPSPPTHASEADPVLLRTPRNRERVLWPPALLQHQHQPRPRPCPRPLMVLTVACACHVSCRPAPRTPGRHTNHTPIATPARLSIDRSAFSVRIRNLML